tara:strand:- start:5920 stop:6567 length:648 start_codon:yes stop_codon:yes gene_type:complete
MKNNFIKRIFTSVALIILLFLMFLSEKILIIVFLLFGVLSILEFLTITDKIFKNIFYKLSINIIFISYIFIFCILFVFGSNYFVVKTTLYSLIFCCVGSDLGGYVIGKILKGPKLTKISPSKTVSGSIGSLFFGSFFFSIVFFFFTNQFNYQILLIGIVTSISSQIGDLFFSYIKRKAFIKDSGKFLPGHGGALDRLDGILFGIPLGFLSISFLH